MSNPLSKEYIDEVRMPCKHATPGPWMSYVEGRDFFGGENVIVRGPNKSEGDLYLSGATTADQDFIAQAREDIPLLLDEIDRLRALLDQKA